MSSEQTISVPTLVGTHFIATETLNYFQNSVLKTCHLLAIALTTTWNEMKYNEMK